MGLLNAELKKENLNERVSRILAEIEKKENKGVILNLEEMKTITTKEIGKVLKIRKCASDRNKYFAVYGVSQEVRNVLVLIGLDNMIDIYNTQKDAMSAYHFFISYTALNPAKV